MDKAQILKCVLEGAEAYQRNVLNQQFLFVYAVDKDKYQYSEVVFKKENYQHLTGTWIPGVKNNDFFDRCIARRVSPKELKCVEDGTAPLKLEVLSAALNGVKNASMFGFYDDSRIFLRTDEFVGGVHWCIGFMDFTNGATPLFANTLLKEDIRKVSRAPIRRIVLTMQKGRQDKKYSKIVRAIPDLDVRTILNALNLSSCVDLAPQMDS